MVIANTGIIGSIIGAGITVRVIEGALRVPKKKRSRVRLSRLEVSRGVINPFELPGERRER